MKIRQIWVMWSAADLWYEKIIKKLAFELWKKLAQNKYILVYGAEKDSDSLSMIAARGAKSKKWIVMWITYGKTPNLRWKMKKYTDCIVCTGMERWGWREYVLVSSCDAIITIWWGSGTLNEITIAYQKKIPIICIQWTWGWSDKLANQYIDERYKIDSKRYICKWVDNVDATIKYLNSISGSPSLS